MCSVGFKVFIAMVYSVPAQLKQSISIGLRFVTERGNNSVCSLGETQVSSSWVGFVLVKFTLGLETAFIVPSLWEVSGNTKHWQTQHNLKTYLSLPSSQTARSHHCCWPRSSISPASPAAPSSPSCSALPSPPPSPCPWLRGDLGCRGKIPVSSPLARTLQMSDCWSAQFWENDKTEEK